MLEKKTGYSKEEEAKSYANNNNNDDLPPPYEEVAGSSNEVPEYANANGNMSQNQPNYTYETSNGDPIISSNQNSKQNYNNFYPAPGHTNDFINYDPRYNFGVNADSNKPIVIPGNPQPVAPANAPLQQQVRPMHNTNAVNSRRTYPGRMNSSYGAQYEELQRKKENGQYNGP